MHIALAERQLHAGLHLLGYGHTLARRVQPDDVAHHHIAAKVAGAAHGVAAHPIGRMHQPGQRGAHHGQRLALLVQRHLQVAQQHLQRRFTIQLQRHVAIGLGDGVHRCHRQAALRNTRHQRHPFAKRHTRQTAAKHPTGRAMALDVAVAAHRKLHGVAAAR